LDNRLRTSGFSQVPFMLFQQYSPALNLPQILEILDPLNKKDLQQTHQVIPGHKNH